MVVTTRGRFLIALAKLLGESPTQPKPLASTLVCEDWLFDETLAQILTAGDDLSLTVALFNQLMLNCGRRIVTPHFYDYFFGNVKTISQFEDGVETFRVKAMWLFGNFRFAYKTLAACDKLAFEDWIGRTLPRDPVSFSSRSKFQGIEKIPRDDLGLLGYISGGEKVRDLDVSLAAINSMRAEFATLAEFLTRFGAEKQKKLADTLAPYGITFPEVGIGGVDAASLSQASTQLTAILEDLKKRQSAAIAIAKRNTDRYVTLPYLDVYVATSMRTEEDYKNQNAFIEQVFSNPQINSLNLRYFDPTLSYADGRITKGLIEMLMLLRADVTIYSASEKDTLGKDSELAATLARGKAVIAYVPPHLDWKAKQLRVDHPLGLQISVNTGVAHGIIIVRSPEECAKMLRKVVLRERKFTIRHEADNYLLEEVETKSILRVVTDNPLLSHAFWSYFRHHRETDVW